MKVRSRVKPLDQLTSELLSGHQNVLHHVKGLHHQCEQLTQGIRAKTAGPVHLSLKKREFEVVRLVPLQEQFVLDNL